MVGITKENNHTRGLDKNLQDDWLPNQQREIGATSKEITEYGGDLKRKNTIGKNPKNPESQPDANNWKKKDVE